MKNPFIAIAVLLAVALSPVHGAGVTGFGKPRPKVRKLYDCHLQMEKAIKQYQKRRFGDVKISLDEIKIQCAGSSVIDTVHYYLGKSQLAAKAPVDARIEFEALIHNFPNSPFAEESHFRIGQCSFNESNPYDRDQSKTRDAIRELTDFVEQYPQSVFADSAKAYTMQGFDKLAKKQFSIARFYDNLNEAEAAVVYYRAVIAEFPQTSYAEESMLRMAAAFKKVNRISEALAVIDELLQGQHRPEIMARAKTLQAQLKSAQ